MCRPLKLTGARDRPQPRSKVGGVSVLALELRLCFMGAHEANIVDCDAHGVPAAFLFLRCASFSCVSAGYGVGPVDLVRVAHVRAGAARHVGGGHESLSLWVERTSRAGVLLWMGGVTAVHEQSFRASSGPHGCPF